MSVSKLVVSWSAENVLSWNTSGNHATQRDLNRYYLLDVYCETRFAEHVMIPGWFSEHAHLARPEKEALVVSLKRFLVSYRAGGRRTIFRYLNTFFVWQVTHHYDYGTADGLEAYIAHLVNEIRSRGLSAIMARQYLSLINCFLLASGQIKRKYEYEFFAKGAYPSEGKTVYTRNELAEILRLLSSINEFLAGCLREHLAKIQKGVRHFSPGFLAPVFAARFRHPRAGTSQDVEIVIRDVVEDYFVSSFYLFCYHTWGNTGQVIGLSRTDIHMDEKGIHSDYVYKGRAYKYIHLTIGKSEYVTKRAGYHWFLSFIALRDELVSYLVADNDIQPSQGLFLSGSLLKTRTLVPLNPNHLTKFCTKEGAWASLRALNPSLPAVMVSRLRKTAEQYTDRALKNGLITAEKAQHDWKTYRKNYAAGNPLVAKENLSAALDTLLRQGIGTQSLSERVIIADELGIDLRGAPDGVSLLLNGLGCRTQDPPSDTELRFMTKQKRFGRKPKACADYSNCVECPKSCVVETLESVWLLLSFKHAIEYGKPVYIGSANAAEHYEALVMKIELRLRLVDDAVLKKAQAKLHREGAAEVWRI